MAEASWNLELHSLLGSPSENSAEMSLSSLSLNMTSDESIHNDSLESNDSFGTRNDMSQYLDNRNVSSILLSSCTPAERKSMEYKMVINNPDAVQWSLPTKTVEVKKSKSGRVGFEYKMVEKSSSYYLLVLSVSHGSPAYDKLRQGDLILSVNGRDMGSRRNKIEYKRESNTIEMNKGTDGGSDTTLILEFESIVKNASSVLKFVVQSPMKLLPSKLYQNTSFHVNDKYEHFTKSDEPLNLRWKINNNVLDLKMTRLPFLKLIILGKLSSSLTVSLIGGTSEFELKQTSDVTTCSYVDVKKWNKNYDWVSTQHSVDYFSDVIEKLKLNEPLKSLQGQDSQFLQNIRLNIISVRDGHVSDSCYQLILCKHAIYAIQFSVEQLITDPTPVLQTIQKHLCKIRCYASTSVRIYLIGTKDSDFSCNVCEIGKVLHDRFSASYGKMLQYNAKTNVPCFVVTLSLNNQQKMIPRGNLKLSGDTCSGNRSFEPQKQHNDQLHCAHLYEVQEVINHISRVAIRQEFVETYYPYRYLQLHKQVHHMRLKGSKCVSPMDFSLNRNDVERSLTYLHDTGEIINAGNLVFHFSTSATPNYLIMIDPQHLLKAACAISMAPREAECRPQDYDYWSDLKTHARAEKRFLVGLAGGKFEVDFLEVMSVIHCLQRCDYRGVDSVNNGQKEMYLVPVYLKDSFPGLDPKVKRKLHQQLCIDFEGFIPDGLFLRSAMLIIQCLKPSRVGWSISYRNSIHVQIPGKYEFVMECDSFKGIINVNAMWYGTCPLNLLSFLTKIFNKFKSALCSQKLKFLIGPPCPLSCDECQQRRGIDWKTHVVDLSLYSQHNVLMCGQERIDKHEHVSPWVQKKSSISIPQMPDDVIKYLSSETLVQDLPAKVTQIICDRLNGHDPLHRNWEGLGALLEYKCMCLDILRRETNPTMALLRDYSRQQNSTLGQMFKLFEQLGRRDIIQIINDTYKIVE